MQGKAQIDRLKSTAKGRRKLAAANRNEQLLELR